MSTEIHYGQNSLTGTPMQNKVDDFFSLFKFMGPAVVAPMNQWDSFKSKIADPVGHERVLQVAELF